MMPLERRNQPQMLRSFWKQYPSYRVQPLLYKRYNELLEARAFFCFAHAPLRVGRLALRVSRE